MADLFVILLGLANHVGERIEVVGIHHCESKEDRQQFFKDLIAHYTAIESAKDEANAIARERLGMHLMRIYGEDRTVEWFEDLAPMCEFPAWLKVKTVRNE